MEKAILSSLPKFNGTNWFEWKKEAETFLMLASLDGVIDAKEVPDTKAAEWTVKDRKVYAYIFFLVEPNYRAPILDIKSGREAWNKLVSEHEKDNATTRIGLRQQFYTLSHNPSLSIVVFIDAVTSIARQLASIGHKLDDLEISDKLLIGLHQLWAPVRTALTLREKSEKPEIEKITAALKQFEANESLLATTNSSVKKEESESNSGELALGAKIHGGGLKGNKGRGRSVEEYDWGNSKGRDDVCWRCGREGHVARLCVADMPQDVKQKVFDHALTAVIDSDNPDEEMFAFILNVGHDPPGEFAW
jgi:hypothetical protein